MEADVHRHAESWASGSELELGRAHAFKPGSTSDYMTEQFCVAFHYGITCRICQAQIAAPES